VKLGIASSGETVDAAARYADAVVCRGLLSADVFRFATVSLRRRCQTATEITSQAAPADANPKTEGTCGKASHITAAKAIMRRSTPKSSPLRIAESCGNSNIMVIIMNLWNCRVSVTKSKKSFLLWKP
jgi:hypothetical protein